MKLFSNFLKNQQQYLDKYVHFTLGSFINLVMFGALTDKFLALWICLGIALGWELLQRILGGKNTVKEMAMDALSTWFTAIMFYGLLMIQ
jgi:hypothetical protein